MTATGYQWYKKQIKAKEYDSYYAGHPGYHKLVDSTTDVVVAFRKPAHVLPRDELELCTPAEVQDLEWRLERHGALANHNQ